MPYSLAYFTSHVTRALLIKGVQGGKSKPTLRKDIQTLLFYYEAKMTSRTWTKQMPGVKRWNKLKDIIMAGKRGKEVAQ